MKNTVIAVSAVALVAFGFYIGQGSQQANPTPLPAVYQAPIQQQITTTYIRSFAIGKSMSEIRAKFGEPTFVSSDGDTSWFYSGTKLRAYDPDSGVTADHVDFFFDPLTKTVHQIIF